MTAAEMPAFEAFLLSKGHSLNGAEKGVPCGTREMTGFPGALRLANFRCRFGTFWGACLDWVVEREGVIKCLTVRHLIFWGSVAARG